jgi:hypothetical protein
MQGLANFSQGVLFVHRSTPLGMQDWNLTLAPLARSPRRDDQKLDVRNSKATLPVSGWRTPPLSSTQSKQSASTRRED